MENEIEKKFWKIFNEQDNLKIEEFQKYMDKFAVNFNLYKDGNFIERSLPFDVIPRIMSKAEYDELDRGLSQRIKTLNLFLEDLYTEQKIIKDGIIPFEFIEQAKGYLKELQGFSPNKKIRTHISGVDLVKDTVTDKWIILEDNLRVPELKGLLGTFDMVVSERTHGGINAASMLVPTLWITHPGDHRTYGIVGKTLNLPQCLYNIEYLNSDELSSKILELYESRDNIHQTLISNIPKAQELTMSNGVLLKEYVLDKK